MGENETMLAEEMRLRAQGWRPGRGRMWRRCACGSCGSCRAVALPLPLPLPLPPPMPADDAMPDDQDELTLGALVDKRRYGKPVAALDQAIVGALGAGADLWTLVTPARLAGSALNGPGLYLFAWPKGRYLGKADSLRVRLLQHMQSLRRFVAPDDLARYRVYTLGTKTGVAARDLERTLLTRIRSDGDGHFRNVGFTNVNTELDLH